MLELLKTRYKVALDANNKAANGQCCCCGRVADKWYSKDGQQEYEKSTICEYCYDALADPSKPPREMRETCLLLTEDGLEVATAWLMLRKARVNAVFQTENEYRHALRLATGQVALPQALVGVAPPPPPPAARAAPG